MKKLTRFAWPYGGWMMLFVIVPLLIVVWFAFTNGAGDFTLDNFISMKSYGKVFGRSFGLAIITTVICLVLGYPLAYIMSKLPPKKQGVFVLLTMLPMWMNFLLRTYAWLTILENTGLLNRLLGALGLPLLHIINTPAAVALGMIYNYLPFMVLPIYTALTKMDHSLIEAARDLGCSSRQVFVKVVLPLSLPGVISGITMVFVPGVSTFVISKLLGGGTSMMVGDLIDIQFLGGAYNPNLGAAISLVMMIVIFLFMGIMQRFDDEKGVK
ncbi:MAG: ABC transporter permease [Clostridiales bacterium]|nr:ABC transporter permease [Clostridiales bacterium]